MKRVPPKMHVNLFRVLIYLDINILRGSCLLSFVFFVFFFSFSFPEATIPLVKYQDYVWSKQKKAPTEDGENPFP